MTVPKGVYLRTSRHCALAKLARARKVYSESEREATRERMQGNNYALGMHHSQHSRDQMSLHRLGNKYAKGTQYTEAMRKAMSLRRVLYIQTRNCRIKLSNPTWFTDRLGRRMFLRSSYELQFAQWLDKQSLTWSYQPKAFLDADGISHYLPDFYVEEFHSYVEVKCLWRIDVAYESKRLLECMYGERLLIVSEDELSDLKVWRERLC